MKVFASDLIDLFEELSTSNKPVKIAVNKKSKVEYYYDPKDSVVYGWLNGKPTATVFEYAIKDSDYLEGLMDILKDNKNINILV